MAHRWRQIRTPFGQTDGSDYQEVCDECGYKSGKIFSTLKERPLDYQPDDFVFVVWKDKDGTTQSDHLTCDEYKVHSVLNS